MIPSAELAALQAVAGAATQGEWCADNHGREFSERDPAYYAVEVEMNKLPAIIVDTLNCDSCLTLDEQRANAAHIAALSHRAARA